VRASRPSRPLRSARRRRRDEGARPDAGSTAEDARGGTGFVARTLEVDGQVRVRGDLPALGDRRVRVLRDPRHEVPVVALPRGEGAPALCAIKAIDSNVRRLKRVRALTRGRCVRQVLPASPFVPTGAAQGPAVVPVHRQRNVGEVRGGCHRRPLAGKLRASGATTARRSTPSAEDRPLGATPSGR
jgi:hypothetical protein